MPLFQVVKKPCRKKCSNDLIVCKMTSTSPSLGSDLVYVCGRSPCQDLNRTSLCFNFLILAPIRHKDVENILKVSDAWLRWPVCLDSSSHHNISQANSSKFVSVTGCVFNSHVVLHVHSHVFYM